MTDVILKGVEKSYGNVNVLKDINLDIKQGEFVVFVGPSGCGKSTLLRMIAGLERITGGELHIDGLQVNDIPPAQRGVAMVFQSYALYPHMTVRENMAFALRIAKKSKKEIDEAVVKASQALRLEEYLDRLPKDLSGGQRQRVAIGRSIVRDPKVFLFDEPLSNLDAALRVATRLEIARLKESMPDRSMIYVTHDQVEALTLADRIVVLNNKGIEQVGTPMELYHEPATEFVAQFIGSPAMNLFKAKMSSGGSETTFDIQGGEHFVRKTETLSKSGDGDVHVGIRPEHLIQNQENPLISAVVEHTEDLGEFTLVHARCNNEPIIAKVPGSGNFSKGDELKFGADAENIHIFQNGRPI